MSAGKTAPLRQRYSLEPFIVSLVLLCIASILLATLVDIELVRRFFLAMQDAIVENFAWLFSLVVTFLLLFSVWLACSRFAHVKLGSADSVPDFSLGAWLSMLFSAGMGIGLVFYGVAEPVLHYIAPPNGAALTPAAAREAMRLAVFHWGLHAWSIYTVLGLALALFHFRYHQPLAIRSVLLPMLGSWTHRWPGKAIDALAVLGTLFGLATSLGLGAAQINAGLFHVFGMAISVDVQVLIIIVVTMFATLSLVLGLNTGIRRLSELNMLLAAALLLFVLLAGPTATLLRGITDTLGNYVQGLPELSLRTHPFRDLEWQKSWTIFYWAWWLAWAPFVGTFIARISQGRTIREFVLGVLLLPTVMSLVWFGVFGGAALQIELLEQNGIAEAVQEDPALAIYALLEHYPYVRQTSILAMLLVAIFFITSSDSGSFVVDMLCSGGNPNPPVWQRILWASIEGLLAITLLYIGGLNALQAGVVSLGLPFSLVIIGVVFCLYRRLRMEPAAPGRV